jgi:hypothetical protein
MVHVPVDADILVFGQGELVLYFFPWHNYIWALGIDAS